MTKKKLGVLAAVALVALSLSGCFRATQDITLNEDGTASGVIVFAFHEDFAEGADLATLWGEDDPSAEFDDVTISEYNEGGWIGQQFTFNNAPLDTWSDGDLSIVREGDNYVVTGSLGSESDFALDGIDIEPVTYLKITFPGAVSDHNGSLSGNTVTWDVADGQFDVSATGSAIDDGSGGGGDGGGSSAIIWVLLILLIIGGAAAFFVLRNRNSNEEAAA